MQNRSQKSKVKSQKLHNILLEIVERKKQDLVFRHPGVATTTIGSQKRDSIAEYNPPNGGLQNDNRLINSILRDKVALIAEIKFASPTNPNLGLREELLERAKAYEKSGADAISIITEPHFFKGDVSFVSQVKKEVSIPVLQKDFVIDERQIYQAKEIGSDALLLIARLVDEKTLKSFVDLCFDLGIEPVVEINNEEDLEKAITTETNIIAVNARDLETFHVDISVARQLMKKIPDSFIRFGFSGISSAVDVKHYQDAGAKGVLIGTSLMTTRDIHGFLADLRGVKISENQSTIREDHNNVKVKICGIRTLDSAEAAVAAGADFLGFNFVPTSKRKVFVETAEKIISSLRAKSQGPRVKIVGVFQNQQVEVVNKIAKRLDLDFVQLHGEEDEEYIKKIIRKIIKKVELDSRLRGNDKVEYVLLDREVQGEGEMVDVEKAAEITRKFQTFFSGGLTADNVSEVVKKVKPFAVDVAGGIETNGEIDDEKVKIFIHNTKGGNT